MINKELRVLVQRCCKRPNVKVLMLQDINEPLRKRCPCTESMFSEETVKCRSDVNENCGSGKVTAGRD